jgi:hypothetical protein
MKANGKPKIKCSKHVSYTYIFEESTQNTHPSIQKAVPACYHANLLIKYIFSFDDSKTKYVKEENRKRKEIQQPGYTAFEWPNIYIYILFSFLRFIGDLNLQKPLNQLSAYWAPVCLEP